MSRSKAKRWRGEVEQRKTDFQNRRLQDKQAGKPGIKQEGERKAKRLDEKGGGVRWRRGEAGCFSCVSQANERWMREAAVGRRVWLRAMPGWACCACVCVCVRMCVCPRPDKVCVRAGVGRLLQQGWYCVYNIRSKWSTIINTHMQGS